MFSSLQSIFPIFCHREVVGYQGDSGVISEYYNRGPEKYTREGIDHWLTKF